jgi:serine/threonine-protein kinase
MGIIHRDISPANIMVSYHGTVKLLDFGIAKATSRISATRSGGLKGKLGFLSPEQISDTPIDAAADVFCLGITFYLLVANRHPWRRDTEVATMHAIVHDELPDPRAFREHLPRRGGDHDEGARAGPGPALPQRRRDGRGPAAGADQDRARRGAADVASFMVALFGQRRCRSAATSPTWSTRRRPR